MWHILMITIKYSIHYDRAAKSKRGNYNRILLNFDAFFSSSVFTLGRTMKVETASYVSLSWYSLVLWWIGTWKTRKWMFATQLHLILCSCMSYRLNNTTMILFNSIWDHCSKIIVIIQVYWTFLAIANMKLCKNRAKQIKSRIKNRILMMFICFMLLNIEIATNDRCANAIGDPAKILWLPQWCSWDHYIHVYNHTFYCVWTLEYVYSE